jgi:NAD-dependent dihydropyrimidine dehydrogenase PreA subunit
MGIRKIDYSNCDNCLICVGVCPMDVFRHDQQTGRPIIRYLADCMSCFYCETKCPKRAIFVTPDRERRIPLPWIA